MTEASTSKQISSSTYGSWLRWLLVVLLLPSMVVGMLLIGIHSESGTRVLWQLSTRIMHDTLSGEYVGGTLAKGMHLRNVMYHDTTQRIAISRIDSSWQINLSPFMLHVDYLHIGDVDAHIQSTSSEPITLPERIVLPLHVKLNDISLAKLSLHQGIAQASKSMEFRHLKLYGASDRFQHALTLEQLDTPYGSVSAKLQLQGVKPFTMSGGAELSGVYQQEKYQLNARLSGTLTAMEATLRVYGDKLNGSAKMEITPFNTIPFQRVQLTAQHVNPKLFNADAPQADLSLHADLAPELPTGATANHIEALVINGPIRVVNGKPGRLDRDLLPLISVAAQLRLDMQTQKLSQLQIKLLQDASIDGDGEYHSNGKNKGSGALNIDVSKLDLHALHGKLKPSRLRGPVSLKVTSETQQIALNLSDAMYKAKLEALIDAKQIVLKAAQLSAGSAHLNVSGTLARDAQMGYALNGTLRDFDPFLWIESRAPKPAAKQHVNMQKSIAQPISARINMDFDAVGRLAPEHTLKLRFGILESHYDNLPMAGNGTLSLAGMRLLPSDVKLSVAGNDIQLQGNFGVAGDRLNVKIDAPQLQRLGFGLSGALSLDGQVSGTLQQPDVSASYRAEKLILGEHQIDHLSGKADIQAALRTDMKAAANRLALDIEANGYRGPGIRLDKFNASLSGTYASHVLKLESSGALHSTPVQLTLAAQGQITQDKAGYGWQGTLSELQNTGVPRLALHAPLSISVAMDHIVLGASRLHVEDAIIDLKKFSYEKGKFLSAGTINALKVGTVLDLLQELSGKQVPIKTDLVLDGSWDLALQETASGFMQIARRHGDLSLNPGRGNVSLNLSMLTLRADLQANQIKLDIQIAADRIGALTGQWQLGLQHLDNHWTIADNAPISGKTKLSVPQLKSIGALIGPQIALDGSIVMDLNVDGGLNQPKLSGAVNGDKLAVILFDQGIKLRDGIARIILTENVIDLQQLEFHGGEGTLRANGRVQLGHDNPDLAATVIADRLQLFASPDRQLMLSGQAKITNLQDQLHVDGKFAVDKALFDLPKESAPTLSDDVIIVRRDANPRAASTKGSTDTTEKPAGSSMPVMNVALDFGNNFRFRGSGADLLLRGAMAVRSEPFQPLRATGTISVADGTYEVFGRKLAIERGLINFVGPIEAPSIFILAMKRNQDIEAGAEITGTPSSLRVRLVSEPNVSDEEKLSWLMFGHGSDSAALGQRKAASQALALLGNIGGKKIAQGIGFDEFSIGSSDSGLNEEHVVNLGKAITEKINLGYEQSLTSAASILKLTWQFSRRWSMVLRGGTINGIEVLYNLRFD